MVEPVATIGHFGAEIIGHAATFGTWPFLSGNCSKPSWCIGWEISLMVKGSGPGYCGWVSGVHFEGRFEWRCLVWVVVK